MELVNENPAVQETAESLQEQEAPEDAPLQEKEPRRTNPVLRILGRIFLVLFAAAAVIAAVFLGCPLRTVYVEGNTYYSSDEIAERILSDGHPVITHNTVFLTVRHLFPGNAEIPFVRKAHISLVGTDAVRIVTEEKTPAAYTPYQGQNLYFSADGSVEEISPMTLRGVTYVGGLRVKGAEKGFPLIPEEKNDLRLVLEALRTLEKYDLHTECLRVTENGAVDLFLGELQVKLGKANYDLKISRLALIMPYLPDRGGLIDMSSFTEADENIVLQ